MKTPAIPANESARLQALERLDIIYTPAEERFDRVTRIASRLFKAPISLVSLVTRDKQWFKSRMGLSAAETGRQISFCGHAILNPDAFVVANALKDPDFRDNPLVTGPPNIRFYAGQPLHFGSARIGTLCVIDTKPRQLRPADYDSLQSLGKWVELELLDWYRAKNTFVRRVLNLTDRHLLIDPLTGNLNNNGIQLLQTKMDDEKVVAQQLIVRYELIDGDEETHEQLRIRIANALRTKIDDRGLIGFAEPNCFQAYLFEQGQDTFSQLLAEIRTLLARMQEADTSGWTWQITER